MSNPACRYYTERTLGWMLNNKIIVLLSMLSFCLFVSTLTLAGQKNRALNEVEYLKNSLKATETTTPDPTTVTTNLPIEGGGDGNGDGNGEGNGDGNGNGEGNGDGNGDGNANGNGNDNGDGTGNGDGSGSGDGNEDGAGNGEGNGNGDGNVDGNGDSGAGADGNGESGAGAGGTGDNGAGADGNGANGEGVDGNPEGNKKSEGGGTVKGEQSVGVRGLRWLENDAVPESENVQDSLDGSLSNSKLWRLLGGA